MPSVSPIQKIIPARRHKSLEPRHRNSHRTPSGVLGWIAFPLLLLLHLGFTLSSIVLRIAELIFSPSLVSEDPGSDEEGGDDNAYGLHSSGKRARTKPPPKHVGLCFPASSLLIRDDAADVLDSEKPSHGMQVLLDSVERCIPWAGEEGVSELSVHSPLMHDPSVRTALIRELERPSLPLSPPASGASSPTREPEGPRITGIRRRDVSDLSGVQRPSTTRGDGWRDPTAKHDDGHVDVGMIGTTTLDLFIPSGRSVKVHLLPPSFPDLFAAHLPTLRPAPSQETIDQLVRSLLHSSTDPDLLIIHPLPLPDPASTSVPFLDLSSLKGWLPRPAPQLHGYPFWTLRITEIYAHPAPLPLPGSVARALQYLIRRARRSRMGLVRKAGRRLPDSQTQTVTAGRRGRDDTPSPSPAAVPRLERDEVEAVGGLPGVNGGRDGRNKWLGGSGREGQVRDVKGAMGREVWEGAMRAWDKVEQRRGK